MTWRKNMPLVLNDRQLARALKRDMDIAIEQIAIDIESNYLEENILDIVYRPYEPSTYERHMYDGGFVGSWTVDKTSKASDSYLSEFLIHSDPKEMTYDGESFVHGNDEEDRREIMPRAIAEGTDWDWDYGAGTYAEAQSAEVELDPWWQKPRDYMTPTLEQVSEVFEILVVSGFSKVNLDVYMIK